MKKIILVLLLVAVMFIVVGCMKVTDEYGIQRVTTYGFTVLRSVTTDGSHEICYDPETKICYVMITGIYRLALSPYYIIGEDGKPEIAAYGVNYK